MAELVDDLSSHLTLSDALDIAVTSALLYTLFVCLRDRASRSLAVAATMCPARFIPTANAMPGCNAPRVPTVTCKTLNAAFFCMEVALRADLINAKLCLQVLLDQLSHRLG